MGQPSRTIVPLQLGCAERAVLVAVGCSVVVIEGEVAVRARVHAYLCNALLFRRAFDRASHGKDGTRANKDRNGIDGCGYFDPLPSANPLIGPEVVPVRSRGQVDTAFGRALLRNWSDQQRRAEHVLIAKICDVRVIAKVQEQTSHERRTGLVCRPAQRVQVRHQLVAQPQILLKDGLRLLAIAPHLVVRA